MQSVFLGPVQIIRGNDDHTFTLCENELAAILMSQNLKDTPVVVVSVAGSKSFAFLVSMNNMLSFQQSINIGIFILIHCEYCSKCCYNKCNALLGSVNNNVMTAASQNRKINAIFWLKEMFTGGVRLNCPTMFMKCWIYSL